MGTESTWPRYAVQIDEEGYPVFDGLRVDDEKLLREILGNIHRRDPTLPASAFQTTCDGEACWIDAFDAPWVARTVEKRLDGAWDWILPGGLRYAVRVEDLEVDNWNRLHAWIGPERVPAILSRAAQASFLHNVDGPDRLAPRAFRLADASVSGADFWSEAYQNGKDGWELGKVSLLLEARGGVVKAFLHEGDPVLVPGAGRGHEAAWAATQGWRTTALDFAPEAEAGFRRAYPQTQLDYLLGDAFLHMRSAPDRYAGVLEYTIFCALDPARRAEWLTAVHYALRPGGIYFGVFYLKAAPGGPPFGLTAWELRELTKLGFEILAWERVFERALAEAAGSSRAGQELFVILRKK